MVGGGLVLGPCMQRAALTGRELSEMLCSAMAMPKPFKLLLGERILGEDDSVFGGADGPEPVLVMLVALELPWLDHSFSSEWDTGYCIITAQRSTLEEVRRGWDTGSKFEWDMGSKVQHGLQLLTDTLGCNNAKDALNNAPELAEGLLSYVRAAEACECFLRTKHYDQAATYIDNKHVDAFCGGLHISIKIIDEEYRS